MTGSLAGISSMAMRQVLAEVVALYEVRTGIRVAVESVGGVDAARRVRDGQRLDVVVLASGVMAQLESEGRLVAHTRMDVARSGMAIAVRAGAPRPPVDDPASVRQAILNARAVGYSTGPSGDHLKRLWERWGIADEIAPRAIQAPAGVSVATLIARGEVDLGFQQLSELLHEPGVTILGPLPSDIQAVTVFSAAVASTSVCGDAARAFIAFLTSSDVDEVKRRQRMDPADRSTRDGGDL